MISFIVTVEIEQFYILYLNIQDRMISVLSSIFGSKADNIDKYIVDFLRDIGTKSPIDSLLEEYGEHKIGYCTELDLELSDDNEFFDQILYYFNKNKELLFKNYIKSIISKTIDNSDYFNLKSSQVLKIFEESVNEAILENVFL